MAKHTPERFVRPAEIHDLTGLSPTTIWRLEKRGDFVPRRQLSPGAVGWPLTAVLRWMESRGDACGRSPNPKCSG